MTRCAVVTLLLVASGFGMSLEGQEDTGSTRRERLLEQRRAKAQHLTPYTVSSAESRARALEKVKFPSNILVKGFHGFRPVIGGMPSGSGFVLGGGYVHGLENQYFQFQANGRYSTRGYTTADVEFVIPPPQVGRRIEFKLRGEYRDLTSLQFYGLGNDSRAGDRSTYLLNDQSATAYFWLNPRGLLSLGAEAGVLQARTGSGDAERSIEEVFRPEDVPGFGRPATQFLMTGGWVEFDVRDKWEDPPVGVVARVTAQYFEDTGLSIYDFSRVIGDVKAYVPLGSRNRLLALRLRTSHAISDEDDDIPFYLMETLGGAKDIRGFREFRFRDRRNLLVSAEYRWEVWNYLDFTFFLDAGKVFHHLEDFDFGRMHTGYGFGIRAHNLERSILRLDLARSSEGFRFHISGGPSF